jgi:hypothetical protein
MVGLVEEEEGEHAIVETFECERGAACGTLSLAWRMVWADSRAIIG